MCSRYEINNSVDEVTLRFDLLEPPAFMPAPEVRPTNRVPVINQDRHAVMLRWGLENSWDNKPLINARAETLAEKKSFIPLLENRCLIPASGYFEWRRENAGKVKTRLKPLSGGMIGFAGLFDGDRFTIITCAPSPSIQHIHGRMPVILERQLEADWLDPNNSYRDVVDLLATHPDGLLEFEDADPPKPQKDLFDET